jgi:hypothetical protein
VPRIDPSVAFLRQAAALGHQQESALIKAEIVADRQIRLAACGLRNLLRVEQLAFQLLFCGKACTPTFVSFPWGTID